MSLMKFSTLSHKFVVQDQARRTSIEGISMEVYSRIGTAMPSPSSKLVDFDDEVELSVVFKKNNVLYSDDHRLQKSGKAKALSELAAVSEIEWLKLEPEYRYYMTKSGYKQMYGRWPDSKTKSGQYFNFFELDKIQYKETHFAKGTETGLSQACETNHSLYWKSKPVGTMRYAARAKVNGAWLYSAGKDQLENGDLAVMNQVHRISRKADTGSKILDIGFAHGGLPYYWGSYRKELGWYGSDCAKFVSVALFQSGLDIGYQGTAQLNAFEEAIKITEINREGQLVAQGRVLEYGKQVSVGDVLLRRSSRSGHAALIGEDKNKNGYLDTGDYILHTAWDAPKYTRIGSGTFGKKKHYAKGTIKLLASRKLAGL